MVQNNSIHMKLHTAISAVLIIILAHTVCSALEPIRFSNDAKEWAVPDWCQDQENCVVKDISASEDKSLGGKILLKLSCDFPGNEWAFAIAEYEKDIDLRGYKNITADIYIPKETPAGFFEGRIIVTADSSLWIETKNSTALTPGKWNTIKAPLDITPGGELEYWKCSTHKDCILAHLDVVRKVSVRIEYNVNNGRSGPPYKGNVYIDNVAVE
jgi:hypothetical protein